MFSFIQINKMDEEEPTQAEANTTTGFSAIDDAILQVFQYIFEVLKDFFNSLFD
jgi:hypothetical protein